MVLSFFYFRDPFSDPTGAGAGGYGASVGNTGADPMKARGIDIFEISYKSIWNISILYLCGQ